MAKSEQLKALIESYIQGDDAHFFSITMQIAAYEAKRGHGKLAEELRALIDDAKTKKATKLFSNKPIPITQPHGELSELLAASYPHLKLRNMILTETISDCLLRFIKEQKMLNKIVAHGLAPRKKLLLVGPPGTGKTMSAKVLAGEFSLPLFIVRMDNLITKFMGETSAKLRLIFNAIGQIRGVYLFDEFDSIGSHRGISNDVGEIRRILNSFLQFIDQDESQSIIIAASNHPQILDYALFRRFDDIIHYELPEKDLIINAFQLKLAFIEKDDINWEQLAEASSCLSYADIVKICEDAVKNKIIYQEKVITFDILYKLILERKAIHKKYKD